MSYQTTPELADNSSIRVACRFCDNSYASKESRNRHERGKHSLEIAGVQVLIRPNGIKYFQCTTPGCNFAHRKLRPVCDHRKTCHKVERNDPLEENAFTAKEIVRRNLALGRELFPFLYDQPTGLFLRNSLSLMDWDASLDNPLVPDWWERYLTLAPASQRLGSLIKSEQLPSDSSMDTSSEGLEEKLLSLSDSVPLDVDVKSEGSSTNDQVSVDSCLSKGSSFTSTSFGLEQSQPLAQGTTLEQIEDIEMKLEAIFASSLAR
ncbi:hypothetical protein IW261DRAFT_1597980 [Armillaria novae-zelandiae]|uniref:C2H2-type domain-containing protein n=1 Tax=Armillaria novae-zelandiae TaxID=153914 RepID=A0AA39NN62_9AGAR|nr:hypothetical protein IW261DRAFT_1597980 [Armillaria novae-zelandiae]